MATINTVDKKKALLRFTALYILAIILIALILFSFLTVPIKVTQKVSSNEVSTGRTALNIDSIDNILHDASNTLLQLQTGQHISDSNSPLAMNAEVEAAQQELESTIDSISIAYKNVEDKTEKIAVSALLLNFKNVLITSKALSSKELIADGTNTSKNTQLIKQLQQSLQTKDARILSLENEIRIGGNNSIVPNDEQLQKQLLQNQKLVKANNTLKREIEVLNKRIDALKKFNAGT